MLSKEELQYYIDENWREDMQAHGFSPYIRNQNFWYKIVNQEVGARPKNAILSML